MAQKKAMQKEISKTLLLVSPVEAKEKIIAQIDKGNELNNTKIVSPEHLTQVQAKYKTWWDYTKELLKQIFSTQKLASEFSTSVVYAVFGGRSSTFQDEIDKIHKNLRRDIDRLVSIQERLELFPVADEPQKDIRNNRPVEIIEQITRRFHIVAMQLRKRHDNRTTLDVSDEYDVQDLIHAIMRIFFNDIRPEEWTPSYAGGASRMDFLLKAEQTVVEVKMTRPGLLAKDIGSQLLDDIGRYQIHPDCQTLICFVYDPDGRIVNPDGIERDLSCQVNRMTVKVIIAPKGQ